MEVSCVCIIHAGVEGEVLVGVVISYVAGVEQGLCHGGDGVGGGAGFWRSWIPSAEERLFPEVATVRVIITRAAVWICLAHVVASVVGAAALCVTAFLVSKSVAGCLVGDAVTRARACS